MTPAPASPLLDVSILGPLRAQRSGEDAALGGRRQRAVLARLAIVAGQVVSTDRLIDDLWDGEPPPSAANTLQSYVSNLRKALGGEPPAIERVGDGYRLAPSVGSAAARFEAVVAATEEATDERLDALDRALALWDGPALGDLADEPWARGTAARLDELRRSAEEQRIDVLLQLGRHALVVGELTSAVEAEPLRERLAAQLVLALYRCGRQSEALRAYERTRAHLAEELGLDVGPELARLADAVLRHDPDLEHRDAPNPGAHRVAASMAGTRLPLPPAVAERRARSTFVGRHDELAVLQRAWAAAADGERRLVVVAGEPGMGKTRLAQVLARQVHDAGGQVLWGRCTSEDLVAYQPAVEALRTAHRALGDHGARIVEGRPALRALLPGEGDAVPVSAGRADAFELLEAWADLLDDLAGEAPVLLVVDDLQWADPEAVALLAHLLRHDRARQVLVVATIRRPAGRATPEVDRLLADVRRDGALDRIDLEGVDVDAVEALLADHGVAVPATAATDLQVRTGGNPLFLESLAASGADLAPTDARLLPASVRDVIDQRLAIVGPDTARVLTAAAVGGQRVELDLLAAVADASIDDLLDVIDGALDTGLLAEDEELGWVSFPHALVRQAIVARTTRNREAHLHLRYAAALEGRPEATAEHAAAIADHLLRAGRRCEPQRAAAAATAAGRRALDMYAAADAAAWAERAAEALATVATLPEAQVALAEADLVAAEAHRRLGHHDEAAAAIERVLAAAREAGDGVRFARAVQEHALLRADVGFHFGVVDEGQLDLLDEALTRVGEEHPAERAAVLAWASIARSALPDDGRQRALAEQAVASATALGSSRPDLDALTLLARRLAAADPAERAVRLELGPRMAEAARAAAWTALAMVGRVLDEADLLEAGRTDEARRANEELQRFVAPLQRPGFDALVLFQRAALAHVAGDHELAEAWSARGLEVGLEPHGSNAVHARGGLQLLLARDLGRGGELVEVTRAMAHAFPDMAAWWATHASECAAAGLDDEASDAVARVLEGDLLAPRDALWTVAVTQLGEACWALGTPDHGRAVAAAIEPLEETVAVAAFGVMVLGPLARPRGLALAAAGDLDAAIEALDRAVERADDAGLALWAQRARHERAAVLERRRAPGDRERAAVDRAGAEAWAAAHGVHLPLRP